MVGVIPQAICTRYGLAVGSNQYVITWIHFGENSMQKCEIMLNDLIGSKRTNTNIKAAIAQPSHTGSFENIFSYRCYYFWGLLLYYQKSTIIIYLHSYSLTYLLGFLSLKVERAHLHSLQLQNHMQI
ncbi:putative cullin [Rosa chinensis]|uniref:Putative cullin n=1 Tax=Rosa chinensis TaxID=74649 RepID=A0A2P6SAP2_ROSCH|nr:putative cullin [Rosa chinensis]